MMKLDNFFTLEKKSEEINDEVKVKEYLICNCNNCDYLIDSNRIFSNPNCLNHCLSILHKVKNKKIYELKINNGATHYILNKNQIGILTELIIEIESLINEIQINEIFEFIRNTDCDKKELCQKKIKNFLFNTFKIYKNGINPYKNPINIYKSLNLEISIYDAHNFPDKCKKCLNDYINFLISSKQRLDNTKFFQNYLKIDNNLKNSNFHTMCELILGNIYAQIKRKSKFETLNSNSKLLTNYQITPFHIEIYENGYEIENYYKVSLINVDEDILKIINWVEEKLLSIKFEHFDNEFLKLNDILNFKKKKIEEILRNNFNFLNIKHKDYVNFYTNFKSSGFLFLYAFLIDDRIEEIFIDRPNKEIYLDHRDYGRCRTNIRLSKKELNRFITILRIESNLPLDEANPSIKTEIITSFFQIRVTLIINPLATDGYTLLIRKLGKIYFSIIELIKNQTINIDAAAYILFNLYHKRNITVIGPPGSGKTTFINALDVLTPNHWRKLYLEDIVESIDMSNNLQHQVRFSIKTSQIEKPNRYSKEYQVRESLHRTPDMIYLGEMINTQSINAFFFLLKVGLRCGLSTSHGETPELMIKRWMIEDKISINSIKDLDLIIQSAKINDTNKIKRRIIRISEIDFDKNNLKIIDIFKRNARTNELTKGFLDFKHIYENSPIIKKINNSGLEFLDYNEFISEINYYISILRFLLSEKIKKISVLNKILNRLWVLRKKFFINDWEKIENLTKKYIENLMEDNYGELDN
ncbi:MAG: hypothetical protein EU547_00550 [Promethearchaeota archaeon]|nr:MAG: hypothetical protein EU547_00550 [Candidatus Lokiarchaeota archaeon]